MKDQYLHNQQQVNVQHSTGVLEDVGDVLAMEDVLKDIQTHPDVETVLEVGCRLGYGPWAVQRRFRNVMAFGCDVVPAFIDIAKVRGGAEYYVWDLHDEPPEELDTVFDYVFSQGVLEHVHNPRVALDNLVSVTGGRFYHKIDCSPAPNPSHYTVATPEEWVEWFAEIISHKRFRWTVVGNVLTIEGTVCA